LHLQDEAVDEDFTLLDPRDIMTNDIDDLRRLVLDKKEEALEEAAGGCRNWHGTVLISAQSHVKALTSWADTPHTDNALLAITRKRYSGN
jgi:hypothetical protein